MLGDYFTTYLITYSYAMSCGSFYPKLFGFMGCISCSRMVMIESTSTILKAYSDSMPKRNSCCLVLTICRKCDVSYVRINSSLNATIVDGRPKDMAGFITINESLVKSSPMYKIVQSFITNNITTSGVWIAMMNRSMLGFVNRFEYINSFENEYAITSIDVGDGEWTPSKVFPYMSEDFI